MALKERIEAKDAQLGEYRARLELAPAAGTAMSGLSNADLQRKALELVSAVRTFLAERRSSGDTLLYTRRRDGDQSEEARQQAWDAESQLLLRSSSEALSEFDTRFKVNAILLRDELLSRLPSDSKRDREFQTYEHPTNPIGMTMVADDLERLAKSLPIGRHSAGF